MAAEPQWQEILRFRLAERNTKESAYAHIIEQYRRLAQQTKVLKERNASLLRAVGTVRANPSSSNANVVSTGEDNPVRAAYITSLESQISSLRDELAALYKTQNQNAQRLLAMNETLREKEESSRIENEALRRTKDDLLALQKKIEFHNELISEKDRTAQILHDEISTLQLELGQVEERNQILTKDNAKLLQRWLDAKQAEVQKMNAANEFYEEMRTHKQMAVNWQDGQEAAARGGAAALADAMDDDLTINSGRAAPTANSLAPPHSGNGEAGEGATATGVKDGMRSPMRKGASLTPNG